MSEAEDLHKMRKPMLHSARVKKLLGLGEADVFSVSVFIISFSPDSVSERERVRERAC